MSKGLGKSYVQDMRQVNYHRNDLSRTYVVDNQGKKLAMPKYYKQFIYTDKELRYIADNAERGILEAEEEERIAYFNRNRDHTEEDFFRYMEGKKRVACNRFYKNQKLRKDV